MTGLRRRAVLQGAAAVLAGSGCPGARSRGPAINLVGQSPERGHAVRDRSLHEMRPAERIRASVLIVGGGVAGVAAAWRLARAGTVDVRVVELESELGGTARSGTTDRSAYPMGAHYLPMPHPSFRGLHTLLDDLDITIGAGELDPRYLCRAPVERHKLKGIWHEGVYPQDGQSADDVAQWERWRAHLRELDRASGSDGRRLFDLPVQRSSLDLRHLDQRSMADYLDELGLTSWRLRWTLDYACRDDYGCTLAQTSAFAGLHHFLSRGMEDERDRFLLVWPEGNARLVHGMAQRGVSDDRLHRDTAALFIDPDTGTLLAHDFAARRNVEFVADVVLWAAPRFVLRYVLPPGRDPMAPRALTYAPWLVANVEVSRRPAGFGAPLAWDNVPIDADNLGYVVATHSEDLAGGARPGAVLTYYEPLCADDAASLRQRRSELLAHTAPSLAAHVLGALEGMHPGISATVRRVDMTRWGHAMVRPTPGLLFGSALARARAPIGRVLPCAADVGGLPLFEQAFAGGVQAAEQALTRLGRPAPTIL